MNMKNKSLNSKLKLNKETIANLEQIKGGNEINEAGPKTFLSICKSCIVTNCLGAPGCPHPDESQINSCIPLCY